MLLNFRRNDALGSKMSCWSEGWSCKGRDRYSPELVVYPQSDAAALGAAGRLSAMFAFAVAFLVYC